MHYKIVTCIYNGHVFYSLLHDNLIHLFHNSRVCAMKCLVNVCTCIHYYVYAKRCLLFYFRFYIGCDLCSNWFHGECVSISEDRSKYLDAFVCDDCKKQQEVATEELYCLCKTPYDESRYALIIKIYRLLCRSLCTFFSKTTQFIQWRVDDGLLGLWFW